LRVKENIPILAELVELRREEANILGYSSYSNYVLETSLA
jgi:Zn-dependent oligopeptidase